MVNADDKVGYEDTEGRKKVRDYSEFELLKAEVEVLKIQVNEIVNILRDNNIDKKTQAPLFEELFGNESEEQEEDV